MSGTGGARAGRERGGSGQEQGGAGPVHEPAGSRDSSSPGPPVVLRGERLVRVYGRGSAAVRALAGVDVELPAGRLVVVRGPSGSGKTTLLNLLGGLDRPDAGRVLLGPSSGLGSGAGGERELSSLGEPELAEVRRRDIGFVFQSFGLLPILSARENVGVPLRLLRWPAAAREARVTELLGRLGLAGHAAQRPGELSGGQQQRVAVARALAAGPRVLVADEPTGQLDAATGREVMTLLRSVVDGVVAPGPPDGHPASATAGPAPSTATQVAAVVATHDPALAGLADTIVELRDGAVVRQEQAG